MTWLLVVASVLMVVALVLTQLNVGYIKKVLALLDIESQLTTKWAGLLAEFSEMRIEFGDQAAIEWLDGRTPETMDEISLLLGRSNSLLKVPDARRS